LGVATSRTDSPRSSILGWLLAAVALVALGFAWADQLDPLAKTTFGIGVGDHGGVPYVSGVLPGSPAERQGVKVGDTIDVADLTTSSRFRLYTGSPPGTQLTVRVGRAGAWRPVTLTAVPNPQAPSLWAAVATATITLLIVAVIAFRRPSLATAALVFYGCGSVSSMNTTAELSWIPDPWFGGVAVFINTALSQLPVFALIPFIARFPHRPSKPSAVLRLHLADALFIAAAIGFSVTTILEPVTFVSWAPLYKVIALVNPLVLLAFAMLAYRDESGESRRRIGWVIAGIVVSAAAYNISNTMLFPTASAALPPQGLVHLGELLELMTAALPIALMYAVLRHRVLDIGFALNRGAVYAVLTAIVICIIGLVDWIAGRLISEERLALVIEALATITVGVSLNWLHGRVERIVDQTVFRRRHLGERRIEYRIDALRFAATESSIDDALAKDAPEILELASSAVFRRKVPGGPFWRIAASGWSASDVDSVDPDSLLVRTILAIEKPLVLADIAITPTGMPRGRETPVLAIPINAQHELLGFVLFGGERDGGSLDPSQIALLARLVGSASNAYGFVEARRWRARAAELEHVPLVNTVALD
jgi:hypothetical protein